MKKIFIFAIAMLSAVSLSAVPSVEPTAGKATLVFSVPEAECTTTMNFVGDVQGYDPTADELPVAELVEGNWYKFVLPLNGGAAQGKICPRSLTGAGTWNYQGKTYTKDEASASISWASIVDDYGTQNKIVLSDGCAGNVVYINVLEWQADFCDMPNPAGMASFKVTFDIPKTANKDKITLTVEGQGDGQSWGQLAQLQLDSTDAFVGTANVPAGCSYKYVISYKGGDNIYMKGDNLNMPYNLTTNDEVEEWDSNPFAGKDTVDVTVPNADFIIQDLDGNFSSHIFSFQGYTADSASQVYAYFNTADFHAGTYPDSLFNKDYSYMVDSAWHNYTIIVRTLTDPVITITNDDVTKYYNLAYSFVGNDSVCYNLDMTFPVPYEETWHESVASDGVLDKSKLKYNIHMIDFTDSLYHYNLRLDNEVAGWDTLRFAPEVNNDTCDFCVYAAADTNGYYLLYNHYSGWLAKTTINDSTFSYVGEILCRGNKKFYINCKKPQTAIEDVATDQKEQGTKILRNGQLYIRKDEVIYDAKGARVE